MEYQRLLKLAQNIENHPFEWTLVLGDLHESICFGDQKSKILSLIKECDLEKSDTAKICDYILYKDYIELRNIIFGNIWDGSNFINDKSEKQIELREKYSQIFPRKGDINLDYITYNLSHALTIFPGTILTTCRDELIEAFLEYENSMFVDDLVWTPYDIVTSPRWKKWIELQREKQLFYNFYDLDESGRLLIKLYGSYKKPSQVLLSEKDYEIYYPTNSDNKTLISKYIQNLFRYTNLIFWGADSFSLENNEKENWFENYGLKPLQLKDFNLLSSFLIKKRQSNTLNFSETNKQNDKNNLLFNIKNGLLDGENIKLFWFLYTRRQQNEISGDEKSILTEKIFAHNDYGFDAKKYEDIKLLAMLANSCADFYDLYSLLESAKLHNNFDNKNELNLLKIVLHNKISTESQILLQFLTSYGAGFPLGFLQLLGEEDENQSLEKLKRSGFQLTNTGIIAKRKYRKYLYKKMEYADSIMLTSGVNPIKKELKNLITKLERHLDDSYFYPLDDELLELFINPENETAVLNMQNKMLNKLLEILKEKQEGYHKVRSLLETEIQPIVALIEKIGEQEETYIKRDIDLLYYLSLESGAFPKCSKEFRKSLKNFIYNDLEKDKKDSYIIEYLLIDGMEKSQSSSEDELQTALQLCSEAERLFEKSLSDEFLKQKMHTYFLKCKLYERIYELVGNEEKINIITEISKVLRQAKDCLETQKFETKNLYPELQAQLDYYEGKYNAKKGIFSKDFQKALKYYQKYPHRYKIQQADIMIEIANSYLFISNIQENEIVKYYNWITKAYEIYRLNSDLHGIADVLQSMGKAEYHFYISRNTSGKIQGRSYLSFFKTAKDIYKFLEDRWSVLITEKYMKGYGV